MPFIDGTNQPKWNPFLNLSKIDEAIDEAVLRASKALSIFGANVAKNPYSDLSQPGEVHEVSEKELITEAFKVYDKNKDLYVTEQEFIDYILTTYMSNGKQLPEGMNISDYITQITDKFRRNAGEDQKANIDEFKHLYQPEAHTAGTEHTDVYPPM